MIEILTIEQRGGGRGQILQIHVGDTLLQESMIWTCIKKNRSDPATILDVIDTNPKGVDLAIKMTDVDLIVIMTIRVGRGVRGIKGLHRMMRIYLIFELLGFHQYQRRITSMFMFPLLPSSVMKQELMIVSNQQNSNIG